MIEAVGLTKRFGDRLAVDRLSFTVQPGQVTGFLGPNGAGKSTTMRMVLGLDRPTAGAVTIDGRPFAELKQRSRINDRARQADKAPDFSRLVRKGVPGIEE